jgi:hypothetical protein
MNTFLRALLMLGILAATASASSPVIRNMKPAGGQRGSEVNVTITGQRLNDAQELLFYQPGIEVTKLEAGKDGRVDATLKIRPDATLGLHDFRLRTATGISALRTFSVGTLKETNEVEPNNDFAKPQPIPMDVVVNGVADNEDIDYFAIEAKKGERITAEIEGIRLGLTLFDPYVAILDSRRFEIASSDDSALIWQDGFVSLVAPEDGTYIIAARESAYRGNANCTYRLHVGHFPRPTAIYPAGGKIGESVTVRWIGDVLGERTTSFTLPSTVEHDFGLIAEDEQGTAPYPNVFRLSPFGNTFECEPNDSPAKATLFDAPVALNGVIGTPGDVDHFAFKATKDRTYEIRVFARKIRSPLDSVLSIVGRNGKNVANNDDNNGPDSYIRFKAPKDDEYVLRLKDHLSKGGPDYVYRIEIGSIEPKLTISTPNEAPRRGTGLMAISVPKGNRQAILINATRVDFGGEVALDATKLPSGVTFEAESIPAGGATVPVLFKADVEAPVAATLATISGRPVDSSSQVPTEFISTAELVLGPNNVPFWTRTVDSLAVAVTDEAPFTLEVIEPKVPIVRGGTMDLKVVANRKPGFTAPIAVSIPWNPPGIASKGSIVIPEGKDDIVIPLNANNGADLKTWKIVVNGTYTEPPPGNPPPGNANARRGQGAGRITVSSEFVKLTVASPMIDLALAAVSVERGSEVDLSVKVTKKEDFPGDAQVTLIGLPNKATTEPLTITKDTTDVVFHIKTDSTTPIGEVKSLFCQVVITRDAEPIIHNVGKGRLRVDAPLAQKKGDASKPKAVATGALSRLEKLRLEAKERLKAANEGVAKSPAEAGAETDSKSDAKAPDHP